MLTFVSNFNALNTYSLSCILSLKQFFSSSWTLVYLEKNQTLMFDTFVISKTLLRNYNRFFCFSERWKITNKYQILYHYLCSYYGLAGKSKQFTFFLGLLFGPIKFCQIMSCFLLSVVAGKDCFSLSSSFAFCGKTARKQSCISEFFQLSFSFHSDIFGRENLSLHMNSNDLHSK